MSDQTTPDGTEITDPDREYLRRCLALAQEALDAGDEPFGSVLVSENGEVLFEDRNRVKDGDHTQHPEFAIARWAAQHMEPQAREVATVYTSGEHCPMCSAAHAWVGLGRIVYASSSAQLSLWRTKWGFGSGPVAPLPITTVAPNVVVAGPDSELSLQVRAMQAALLGVNE